MSDKDDKNAVEDEPLQEVVGSFLTSRQIQVLRLRTMGYSQQEVADAMGTTRSNVSILEKRAHQNVIKAKKTILQWRAIQAPVSVRVKAGTDIFEIPRLIFAEADVMEIRLPINSVEVVVGLRRVAPELFEGRITVRDAEVSVTADGSLLVLEPNEKGLIRGI